MTAIASHLLDIASESIVTTSGGGVVTSWNLAAAALYGWQVTEAIGRNVADLFGPYPFEALTALDRTGLWQGTIERLRRNGSTVTVRLILTRESDRPATQAEWIEASSKVYATHPAERALAQSEHRYRNLFGAVAASFWELDFSGVGKIIAELRSQGVRDLAAHLAAHPEIVREMMRATRVVDINDLSLEMFGPGTKRELMATPLDRYWPATSTADYARSVSAALSGKPSHVAETVMRARDGREFEALFTVSFLPGTVGTGTLLIGFTDISERVRATRDLGEANLRQQMYLDVPTIALTEMVAPEMVAIFAGLRAEGIEDLGPYLDGHPDFVELVLTKVRFERVNDAAVRLFGARSRDEIVGRTLEGFVDPGSEVFRRSLEGSYRREPVFQSELRVRRLDGSFLDTLFCRVTSGDPERARLLVTYIDISDQVTMREEADRMRQQVAHAGRISMLGQLSASIVHEISQPITAISNLAEALERIAARSGIENPDLPKVTSRIAALASRAGHIIQRIRAMAADRNIMMQELSLEEVISEVRMLLGQQFGGHGTHVRFVRDGAPPRVRGDRVQLQQILANLLLNAVQAMVHLPADQRRVDITLRTTGDRTEVEVGDRGAGFHEDQLEEPFQSFRTTKPDGIGIGLTISRSIAEAHGGSLLVANRPNGTGALVTLVLPVV